MNAHITATSVKSTAVHYTHETVKKSAEHLNDTINHFLADIVKLAVFAVFSRVGDIQALMLTAAIAYAAVIILRYTCKFMERHSETLKEEISKVEVEASKVESDYSI